MCFYAILVTDIYGNILTLRRHGKHDSGFGLIDKLAYKYNGNQLIKVTDAATTSVTSYGAFQFVDGADVENEYVYDANGNMTEDFNKKISKIEYNLLNLPSKLQFSFGHMTEYSYDGAGRKLSVTYKTSKTNLFVPMGSIVPPLSTNVALTLKTDYCGNMIYENGHFKFYQEGSEIFTSNYGGHKELLMSTTEMLDTVYSENDYYREHRILIKKENSNPSPTSIYNIIVQPVLVLTIYYDHSYNIKAIRNWFSYTTYKSEHEE